MVNVAILGFGTVGSGVADVLTRNSAVIDQRVDGLVRLKYILDVRDLSTTPYADKAVKDFSILENEIPVFHLEPPVFPCRFMVQKAVISDRSRLN